MSKPISKSKLNDDIDDLERMQFIDIKAFALSPELLYRDCEYAGKLEYTFEQKGTAPEERSAWFNDIVGWLISNGKRNKKLCQYVRNCSSAKIESFLLTHGENKFSCSCCGCSAYHLCILGKHNGVLSSLSRRNINKPNWKGETALHFACATNGTNCIDLLLDMGADPNAVDCKGVSPLLRCVVKNDWWKVRSLLQGGARVNDPIPDRYERTLLHLAVQHGSRPLSKMLLHHGANIDAQDEYGMTPLSLAVMYGQDDIVLHFLNAGASTDLRCKNGWSVLHVGCLYQQEMTIKMLLEHGVETYVVDANDASALHEATWSGNANIVQLLTSYGCPLDLEDKYLRTALHIAVMNGHTKIAKHLLNEGASTRGLTAPLQRVVTLGSLDMVQLVARHTDIDTPDRYGNTLLKTAILRNNAAMVQVLLDEGANVFIRGLLNCPIIVEAIRQQNEEIVRILLSYGADVTSCDDSDRPPLFYACRTKNQKIVQMLRDSIRIAERKRSKNKVRHYTNVKSKIQ